MVAGRRNYSREFKEDAVRLLESSGKTGREIEEDFGVGRGLIYRWRRELQEEQEAGIGAFPGKGNPRDEELAQLRKEGPELREERDVLRKAVAIFSKVKR